MAPSGSAHRARYRRNVLIAVAAAAALWILIAFGLRWMGL
jgi:hypothetical protein